MNQLVFVDKNKVITNSLVVAEAFNKQHRDVLRAIRNLGCSDEFRQRNFAQTYYVDSQNREMPIYHMNNKGFALLAMGFTGKEAMTFKERYIEEFERMENFIREKMSSEWKETRIKGKLARRDEMDIIAEKLIPLAESQGSQNAGKLYVVYSKLVNDCVGIPSKSREKATQRTLDAIYNLETLVENVISKEVERGTHYKEIYQITKGRCLTLAELLCLPEQRLLIQ